MRRFRIPSHLFLTGLLALFLAACPDSCTRSLPNPGEQKATGPVGELRPTDPSDGGAGAGAKIVEIAPGAEHAVVLTADGSVWTCGNGGDGQLGWEQTDMCFWGVAVEGLPAIRDIAAGSAYSVFLAEDGTLWGAGYGFDKRLGPTEQERFMTPIELGLGGLEDVAAYTNFTLGRRADGTVVAFGVNDAGGLGHGSSTDSATLVETGVEAVAIDAGGGYALALTGDGHVKSWGINNYGTLGNRSVPTMSMSGSVSAAAQGFFSLRPVDVEIDRVVSISAGTEHALAARDDGTVWGWGRNYYGSLAQPADNTLHPVPVRIPGLSDVVAVAAGSQFSLALTRDGRVLSWGESSQGRLGRTISSAYSTDPTPISGLPPIAKIFAGPQCGYAIDENGRAWAWGANEFGQLLADAEGLGPPVPMVLGGG